MASPSAYREWSPSPALLPWIDCFWIQTRAGDPAGRVPHRVLPDGCAHLLIDLSRGRASRPAVVGPRTSALLVSCATWTRVVGVRFRPGGARPFLGVPLREIADQFLELRELRRDAAGMHERIDEAADRGDVLSALDRELRTVLAEARSAEPRIRSALVRLGHGAESRQVEEVAAGLGITRQRLSRLFRDEVGYGPKRMARILRLQHAIRLLRSAGRGGLAQVALAAGYCDQPHMNCEFRALAGVSPRQLAG